MELFNLIATHIIWGVIYGLSLLLIPMMFLHWRHRKWMRQEILRARRIYLVKKSAKELHEALAEAKERQ